MDYLYEAKFLISMLVALLVYRGQLVFGVGLLGFVAFLTGFEWSLPKGTTWNALISGGIRSDVLFNALFGGMFLTAAILAVGFFMVADLLRIVQKSDESKSPR